MMLRLFTALLLVVIAWSGATIADQFLRSDATFATALTGAAGSITNTMLADMVQATVKGRAAAAGTGVPGDLTQTQLTALVNPATTALSGAVPAWPNNTTTFFRGDGTYAAPPDNGPVLLNTLTANNTSGNLSDTTSLTSTYSSYQISIQNLIPATTANTLILQVHSAGSFQSGASSYQWGNSLADNAGTGQSSSGTDTSLRLGQATRISSTTANGGISGTITVINPSNTTVDKHWFWQVMMAGSSNGQNNATGSGEWFGNQGAVDGFQLSASVGGNWVSGVVKIYGMQ